jgi:cytochrome b involved in lipid metabolism
MRPSLLVLSAVWLALCSCLVWKEHRLSRIFYSFCGCFAAAAALRRLLSAAAAGRHRSLVHLLDGRRKRDALVADAVGALVCAGALHSCARHGRPYAALSLVAGYLAFGQWYTALRLTMEASWGVVEDALTLSAVLVLLATLKDESSLEPRSRQIEVWIAYKLVALLLRLLWPSPSSAHASSLSTQEARKDITANRTLQQKVSSLADNSSSTLTPVPPRRLWTIRGAEYDLSDFVSRHPGGEGAILLGRGRDCTALFESYHPFTTQHRAVLQRYRRRQPARDGPPPEEGAPPQKKPPTTSSPPEEDGGGGDEFYRVLCERVAAALRDQGFDPVRDRAATARRAAYYAGVAAGAAASGWAHVRVSTSVVEAVTRLHFIFFCLCTHNNEIAANTLLLCNRLNRGAGWAASALPCLGGY